MRLVARIFYLLLTKIEYFWGRYKLDTYRIIRSQDNFPWAPLIFQHLKFNPFLFCAPLPSTSGTFILECELKQSYWLLSGLCFRSLRKRLGEKNARNACKLLLVCCTSSTSAWGAAATIPNLSFLASHLFCRLFAVAFSHLRRVPYQPNLKKLNPIISFCPSRCSCLLFLHLVLDINLTKQQLHTLAENISVVIDLRHNDYTNVVVCSALIRASDTKRLLQFYRWIPFNLGELSKWLLRSQFVHSLRWVLVHSSSHTGRKNIKTKKQNEHRYPIWQEFSFPVQQHRQSTITTSSYKHQFTFWDCCQLPAHWYKAFQAVLRFCHPGPTACVRHTKAIFF